MSSLAALVDPGIGLEVHTFTVASISADAYEGSTGSGDAALLPLSDLPPHRHLSVGESILTIPVHVADRISLSAVSPSLVGAVYAGIVPELRSGDVRIMAIARAAGIRSKVAVASTVDTIDAVAALVGRAANRVSYVSRLLGGERLDIIPWSPDVAQFAANALAPAHVSKVSVEVDRIVVSAPSHQMPAAVGGGGLNSHLAGELVGFPVDVVPE